MTTETSFHYIPRVDFRNLGVSVTGLRIGSPHVCLSTPWGNVILKPWADRLFSERYTDRTRHFRLFDACVSWVRLKQFPPAGVAPTI